MTNSDYSENALVEQPALALLDALGWQTVNCFHEFEHAGGSPLGRETKGEVVLVSRLRPALGRLNPEASREAIDLAIEELLRDRGAMSLAAANAEVYGLLKGGVRVTVSGAGEEGGETDEVLRVIDWDEPTNNGFLLCSQFWVTGDMYTRRPDLIGFVNGLPLVFVELKAPGEPVEDAYRGNLLDYRDTVPHLFWYNGLIVLSNGSQSKLGSVTGQWDHFSDWAKIDDETEEGVISLETMLRGTCEPARLLDLVENFTLFEESKGGLIKLIAKCHQYHGVRNALDALAQLGENRGRLGVFWHTQGSGKSVSMVFFAQKVLRKLPGNWTFVVVTDGKELDEQIYRKFANTGAVTEKQAHASSSAHLRRLLTEDHRYVFTLIHKFGTPKGKKHPVLSERSDIIVMTDEAHRTQYDTLALNMRTALPNAAFLAFTGTPLLAGEEKTREVFGDYVSVYNFKESVDDKATVPLYYENRIPELQLTNDKLTEDIARVVEETELDDDQEAKLEREFAREYHLITRDERLDTLAADLVKHFLGRGFQGKAMVVCIDKATAVRMHDKVRREWAKSLDRLRVEAAAAPEERAGQLQSRLAYLEETDMAVVVSQSQGEIRECGRKGADIRPHRQRMLKEDLDTKFKDPDDPFRIVFVCAMWMTGFDVPCCSTIYLDKPMRNHTLMQTIARANRVFGDKQNGLIVDYVGVFRNLQKALALYGSASGGGVDEGETPVADKSELVEALKQALGRVEEFCAGLGIDLDGIQAAAGFDRVALLDEAVEAILVDTDTKKRFTALATDVGNLYKAVLPDPVANQVAPRCALLDVLVKKLRSLLPPPDISKVMQAVDGILDDSIAPTPFVIRDSDSDTDPLVDLSKVDFEALKAKMQRGRKRTEAEKLRGMIDRKLADMLRVNRSRMNWTERFGKMIEEYNAGSVNVEEWLNRLIGFAQELTEEEQRAQREGLSDDELAVFDLLTDPKLDLGPRQRARVKRVARELLERLKARQLVLDWRKRQQSRAAVQVAIRDTLDDLPKCYTSRLHEQKRQAVYQHVYAAYWGAAAGVCASATLGQRPSTRPETYSGALRAATQR